jgi:hypothetical protein
MKFFIKLKDLIDIYIMNTGENKEEAQESTTTLPSEASVEEKEEDGQLTTKKPAEEKKVVVVKPSEVEYKENNQMGNSPAEEQGKEGQSIVAADRAKEAGQSFTDMIKSLGKKAATKAEEKTKELKDKSVETLGTGTHKDTKDIQALGIHADNIVLVYERIMFEIEREDYETQEKLLTGYKELLEEQVNVIDSKLGIAKRLKNISK